MRIGYGRVSTREQSPDAQRDALAAAGCEQIFIDVASGKLARRPELDKALLVLRAGDRLVVAKLDRLGRSLAHLIELSAQLQARKVDLVILDQSVDTSTAAGRMFFQILGAIAEFEHTLMSERTRDGLAAARARGRTGGQKAKLTPRQAKVAQEMYDEVDERGKRRYTVEQIAAEFGVTRPTVYRHLALLAARQPRPALPEDTRPAPTVDRYDQLLGNLRPAPSLDAYDQHLTTPTAEGAEASLPRPPEGYVPYGERRPYLVAGTLTELTGPTTGVVELPPHLDWSGSPRYDLDTPGMLVELYKTVLAEASHVEDLRTWINGERLVTLWPQLWLPPKVRRIWEERFGELAAARTAARAA